MDAHETARHILRMYETAELEDAITEAISSHTMRCRQEVDAIGRVLDEVQGLVLDALTTDGTHHKQWYLERIATVLGLEVAVPSGIAP